MSEQAGRVEFGLPVGGWYVCQRIDEELALWRLEC